MRTTRRAPLRAMHAIVAFTATMAVAACGRQNPPQTVLGVRSHVNAKEEFENGEILATKEAIANAHAALPAPSGDAKGSGGGDGGVKDERPLSVHSLRSLSCDAKSPKSLSFRSLRLTNFHLRLVLEDVFGPLASASPVQQALRALPADESKGGYDTHQRFTEAARFEKQMTLARGLAGEVLASDANVRVLATRLGVTCQPSLAMPWSGCGETFATALSQRLKRKPADADERARLKAVYDKSNALKPNAALAWRGVVTGLLLSPDFLYALETREPDGVTLDARAVGTKLALAVAGSLPDAALLADMSSGAILSPEKRESHARRLLATPAAEANFGNFARQWFDIPTNPLAVTNFPSTPATTDEAQFRAAVSADFAVAAAKPVFAGQGRFSDLILTTSAQPAHPWLAEAYGVAQAATAVSLVDDKRANLFARTGFLATKDGARNLPHRGVFVLERMLCAPLGSPPANATAEAAKISTDGLSHRQKWDKITSAPNCVGCHVTINPIGAVFDEFDGWGRHEATETITQAGMPPRNVAWQTASRIPLPGGVSVDVNGPGDLARAISEHDMARACFAINWVDYAFAFQDKENCMLKAAAAPLFENSPGGVKEMMVRAVSSPEFLRR